MKILIVSYVDDNFGDNLIRICFESLLKVVLKNLHIEDYELFKMSLKSVDTSLICNSDIIFFAGGGLFGLSYLNFFDYLNEITKIADEHSIPVIFSSIGINNMDATLETENYLRDILKRKCIRYISVRENLDLFKYYVGANSHIEIEQVCDPAVWSQYIYGCANTSEYGACGESKPTVGINVVRGGLFKDNKKTWVLKDELNYLISIKEMLDKANIDYKFYTNGSLLDNNTLHYFAQKYNIPDNCLIFPHSTREFIEAVSSFDAVLAIRMHSAIVSYAFDIPSICMVWNDKIPLFYQNINYPQRAISIDEWNADTVFSNLNSLLADKDFHKDQSYLMTLYKYLYKVISKHYNKNHNIFTFEQIVQELSTSKVSSNEDLLDYRLKCDKAEHHYLARFTEVQEKKSEIKKLKNTIKSQEEIIKQQEQENTDKNKKINEQADLIRTQKETIKKQKDRLNHIDSLFVVRVYHKISKLFRH